MNRRQFTAAAASFPAIIRSRMGAASDRPNILWILGEDMGVMSANLSYGRISTELAYGQAETGQGGTRDALMLSTDLAAWSWLTLESDLAVSTAPGSVDRERDRSSQPVAAGRFGLRLNF